MCVLSVHSVALRCVMFLTKSREFWISFFFLKNTSQLLLKLSGLFNMVPVVLKILFGALPDFILCFHPKTDLIGFVVTFHNLSAYTLRFSLLSAYVLNLACFEASLNRFR